MRVYSLCVDNVKNKSLVEIINSDFFKLFRKKQMQSDNHLRPCCIIDNPHFLREAVAGVGAYITHEGAETMVTSLAKPLDEYGAMYKEIVDCWGRIFFIFQCLHVIFLTFICFFNLSVIIILSLRILYDGFGVVVSELQIKQILSLTYMIFYSIIYS
ncbi:MAG: hypothetical protein M1409_07745 [Actinobacteria bacterium]|nr:hypothetical protein [Actinomycetota bacterium]